MNTSTQSRAIANRLTEAQVELPHTQSRPSKLRTINLASLSILTILLCLPATFLAVRAMMPVEVQNTIYSYTLRNPDLAGAVSIAFVFVFNLGAPICAAAVLCNLILVLQRAFPLWLKAVTTLFVLVAILGTVEVRSAIHVFPFRP